MNDRPLFRRVLDVSDPQSLATRLRRRRFLFFRALLDSLRKPIHILDVGGTPEFWNLMGFTRQEGTDITLFNLPGIQGSPTLFRQVVGDARDLSIFKDREFDVVFSNSVIEHVGAYSDQSKMANEVRRVGQRYFVQTPNKHFPIEPHFFVPFFQYLPVTGRAWLLNHFDLGWYKRVRDYKAAEREVEAVRLLTANELKDLFPEANVYRERFLVLTKSLTAYYGW